MLIDQKVTEFIDILASDEPAPGGGSTAALVGSLGAALGTMVCRLSKGDTFASVSADVHDSERRLVVLLDELRADIDADTEAFNQVMAAFKLPKGTDGEKMARTAAIQVAMKGAAELPLKVAKASVLVQRLANKIITFGNPNAASDVAVGGLLAYAALQGAIYNVKINLGSIKDETYVQTMKSEIQALLAEGSNLNETMIELAGKYIG